MWKNSGQTLFCRIWRCGSTSFRSTHNKVPHFVQVWISESPSIYTNLAFEEWLLQNVDFSFSDGLFIYRNMPCVVIGRFQNPWLESDISYLMRHRIDLARRFSGGGAVYHDPDNVNVCFFKSKDRLNRGDNLNFIQNQLKERFGIHVTISKRSDIMLNDSKQVSGSAERKTLKGAYHHCTLLLSLPRQRMSDSLQPSINPSFVETNATRSIRSFVGCLHQANPYLTIEDLIQELWKAFAEPVKVANVDRFLPDYDRYKGLKEIELKLRNWDWIFGHTPKFNLNFDDLRMTVEKGIIQNIDPMKYRKFIGQRFSVHLLNDIRCKIAL